MQPKAEIFSQGEEVVTGQTVDSNAAWLSQRLVQTGFQVTRHTAVGDKLDDLAALLREIAARADCCVCTGGLGPTSDDLTAEAVALAFGLPLEFDAEAYRQIEQFFASRNRAMPPSNRKQALLPQGAQRLDNAIGTAPGFALRAGRCRFAFAPGVPSEMRQMFDAQVAPLLAVEFNLRPAQLVTIKTIGIGESDLQQRLAGLALPDGVQLGFRAGSDDVQTKLLFPPDYPATGVQALADAAARRIGTAVYAIDHGAPDSDIATVLDAWLQNRTLALAETASQGLAAAKCGGRPWLLEALYAADLPRLCHKLGIAHYPDEPPLETAMRSAVALRAASGADLALVQLYDGPLRDPGHSITLHHALASTTGNAQASASTGGPLPRKQNQAAMLALDFLRHHVNVPDNTTQNGISSLTKRRFVLK